MQKEQKYQTIVNACISKTFFSFKDPPVCVKILLLRATANTSFCYEK
jgi:hypothetical protein